MTRFARLWGWVLAGTGLALSLAGSPAQEPRPAAEAGAPLANDDGEKRILTEIAAFNPDEHDILNVTETDGRWLRILVEATRAKNVVELGTAHGYSALWITLGLRKHDGRLTTIEIDDTRVERAQEHFEKAGVSQYIHVIIGNAHEEVLKLEGPIDLLFIDADKDGYLDYLTKLLPRVRPGGLIMAHNMKSPTPDPAFVKAITANPALESQFLNMHDQGMAVILKKP